MEYKSAQAKLSIDIIRKKMEEMGMPDLLVIKDKEKLAEYMMLYIAARIYSNIDTNHFGGKEGYGHVGAVIIIPGIDHIIFYQSQAVKGGWYHAEHGALRLALQVCEQYGMDSLPEGCILIVSMEPCVGKVPNRIGDCCSNLVRNETFSDVFIGYRDRTLADENSEMPQWPPHWKLITNSFVREVARDLYDFYGIWHDEQK